MATRTDGAVSREQFLDASLACESMAGIPKTLAALAAADNAMRFREVLDSIRDHRAKWAAVADGVAAQLVAMKTPVDECDGAEDISAHHTADALAWLAYCRVGAACDNWHGEENVGTFTASLLGRGQRFDTGLVVPLWESVKAAFADWPTFNERRLGTQIRRERTSIAAELLSKPAEGRTEKKKSINQRMIEHAESNRESIYWTARQWADHLHCSASRVCETKAWKTWANVRATMMAERECKGKKTDRRRKPKASDLSIARDVDD